MSTRIICVAIVQFVIFVATQNGASNHCEKCVPVENCPEVGQLSRQEQQRYFQLYTCKEPPLAKKHDFTFLFGFAPIARGDFVCCKNKQQQNQKPNIDETPKNSYFEYFNNQTPTFVNGRKEGIQNHRSDSEAKPDSMQPNDIQDDRKGTGPKEISNVKSNNEQCNALTSFPPEARSNCCGKDEAGIDGVAAFGDARVRSSQQMSSQTSMDKLSMVGDRMFPRFPPVMFGQNMASRFPRSVDNNQNVTVINRISGGTAAELNQFPWTVLLKATFMYRSKKTQAFSCGGSIISSRYVLTAAHCVSDNDGAIVQVQVTLAEYDKRTFPRDCVTESETGMRCVDNMVTQAEDIIVHPRYSKSNLKNDIALLRLRDRIPYTDYIRPICLPPFDMDSEKFKDLPLTIAGWGRDGPYESNIKQYAIVRLVPQLQCQKYYRFLTNTNICAAGYTGEDTCKGDSGGPLMTLREGQYYLTGIVSGKRSDSPCGTAVPSLYTNVYTYLDWILSSIRK